MPFDGQTYDFNDDLLRVLETGRDSIATPAKWGKGHLERGGRRCAIGAVHTITMRFAAGNEAVYRPLYTAAIWALTNALPAPYLGVPDYNDAMATKHKDIMALYRRAIDTRRAALLTKVAA